MATDLVKLPPETTIRKIEAALRRGSNATTAAAMAGVSIRSYWRYHAIPELGRRFSEAAAESKGLLEEVTHNGATKGFVTREIRTITDELGNVKEKIDIVKEHPPDMKTALSLLRARYPEEYGNINRVDTKKIGNSTDQIDKDGTPERPEDPKSILDMVLKGDGAYHLETEQDYVQEEVKEKVKEKEVFQEEEVGFGGDD